MNTGLVVTTTWNYYIDPFEKNRHYIAYTDIGFSYSLDAGKSWIWWGKKKRAPWHNTCYELAFDPEIKGKIWGAFSKVHDIPNSNIISGRHKSSGPGGVCLSEDFGESWKVSNKGMPLAPCTSIIIDPGSKKNNRTLYAGMFGQGVFKSTDDGKSWTKKNKGLGAADNMRVFRVQLHKDGTLFALITAKKKGEKYEESGVGLYRSKDGAENWEKVNKSLPLSWPKDFALDPGDSKIVYISACDIRVNRKRVEQGGLYRTTDGGETWKFITKKGPEHFGAFLHPKNKGWIYITLTEGAPGAGLWLSRDNGKSFKPFEKLPFKNIQRVVFDTSDEKIIYVTTFGGSVWKGPIEP